MYLLFSWKKPSVRNSNGWFSPFYLGGALKRPASIQDDKEVKKIKLDLESTKKEIKDENQINDITKKHLKQLTREVSKTRLL